MGVLKDSNRDYIKLAWVSRKIKPLCVSPMSRGKRRIFQIGILDHLPCHRGELKPVLSEIEGRGH
jgi:hypothetical protein